MTTATATAGTKARDTVGARVLQAVRRARKKGVTCDELVAQLGVARSSVSARLSSLASRGEVRPLGSFRATAAGRPAAVYVLGSAAPAAPARAKPKKRPGPVQAPAATPATSASPAAAASPPVAAPAAAAHEPAKRLKNHFVLVCDHSGSMDVHAAGAAKLFDEQLTSLRAATDQDSSVTVYDFGLTRDGKESIKERYYNAPPSIVAPFAGSPYVAVGNTPLYAAVLKAGQRALCDRDPEKSFVMVVLTDGQENMSQEFGVDAAKLRDFIAAQQATDRWTFVFLVPKGYKDRFVNLSGVHEGNVREWDNVEKAREELTSGLRVYMDARRRGERSSKNWFVTDLSGIGPQALLLLRDVTAEAKTWEVDRESEILTFVNYKTQGGFKPGASFYEIHKKEKQFQDYKKLLLMDKATKKIYADGPYTTVRKLCGFPEKGDVAIDPGNHANFVLFGQSTSTNRLLGRGTRLVFWEGATT